MSFWNPWRGCHRYSEGCLHCYIHKGDWKKHIDTNQIVKTKDFYKPIEKFKNGKYKMKSSLVYVCFSSDFFIEEADQWRDECWKMIKERQDCTFLFLTKRIERFYQCIPSNWNKGYPNVVIGCTIENQKNADQRLSLFKNMPIIHKNIIAQPLLENIHIERYLDDIELVVAGGEADYHARLLHYDWILNLRKQCIKHNVSFEFRQCGSHFVMNGKHYHLPTKDLSRLAKRANINFQRRQEIELILPNQDYAKQIMSYSKEMLDNNDCLNGCAGLEDCQSYEQWLNFENRLKQKYGPSYVPSTVYLAIEKSNRQLIGIMELRHELSPALLHHGGHIGYSVLPKLRKQGYGKMMLQAMLHKCHEQHFDKVLLTCCKDNIASAKIIQANGGILEDEVLDDHIIIQRYWINLKK